MHNGPDYFYTRALCRKIDEQEARIKKLEHVMEAARILRNGANLFIAN